MQHKLLVLSLLLISGFWITSCDSSEGNPELEKIAQVYDKILYRGDIIPLIPANINTEDSVGFTKTLIDKWIRRQLKLYKAEMNLTAEQKDMKAELEEYRSSLLIYKFEQEYIRQKLDTIFTDEEIQEYYNANQKEYNLKRNVVIATMVVVPENVENYPQFKSWFISGNDKYESNIAIFCEENTVQYNSFNDNWVYFDDILYSIPIEVSNQENELRYKKYFEKKNNGNYYLILIHDFILKDNIAPLNIVEGDIVNVLLNKRKINLIRELEEKTFNNATDLKNIIIFKN